MSNRQRMQSDNPLFGQVNPEMASRRGNGGEPVLPAAASSTSSSTAHASAAAADPPPPAFVVTRAMKDEALEMAKETAKDLDFGRWSKLSKKRKDKLYEKELRTIVERHEKEAAKAGESAAKAGESAAKAGESAERREKEAAKADLAARDAAVSLWECVTKYPGAVFETDNEAKPKDVDNYYAYPDSVAGGKFYDMFRSDAIVQMLKKPKIVPNQWNSIEGRLYDKATTDERSILLNEANVARLVANLGKTCCVEVVNRVLHKKDRVFFHEEHYLSETSSRGVKAARITQGFRPDVVGGQALRDELRFVFVGEDKHILVFTVKGELMMDLAAMYNDEGLGKTRLAAVRYAVNQLYTYLCVMKLQCGFLTNYNTWWFCKRRLLKVKDEKARVIEQLVISEPIAANSAEPTLAEACSLFVLTATLDERAVGMEPLDHIVERVRVRYDAYPNNDALNADKAKMRATFVLAASNEHSKSSSHHGTKRGTEMQSPPSDSGVELSVQDIPSLPLEKLNGEPEYGRVLGRGRTGTSFEAKIDGFPLPAVMKIADIGKMETAEDELKHEYGAYMRLLDLWGTVVPFVAWSGRMSLGRAGLATSLAGARTLEQHLKQHKSIDMPALERTLSDGLAQIHARGLAHGDVEMRNIVVDDGEAGLEAKFIDFGSSTVLADDESNILHVREEQQRDLVYLRNILATAKSWAAEHAQECDAIGASITVAAPEPIATGQ